MRGDWISDDRADGFLTLFNSSVALDANGVYELSRKQFSPSFSEVVFGEFTRWCTGLVFFPFDLTLPPLSGEVQSKLRIGPNVLDVPCWYIKGDNYYGYTLGEYYCNRKYNDFRDYEPYTTIQIYLPYYGFIDVNPADVNDKYIQFILNVDFSTGQAMYIVGVNANSVARRNSPYISGLDDDSNTIIIGKYIFNIGTSIPLSQTGMAEMLRNVSMAAISGVLSAAGHAAVASAGLATTTATSRTVNKTVTTARNVRTGRQITTGTNTQTFDRNVEYDASNYQRGRAVNSCFEAAADSLNAMTLRPSTDRANNPLVDFNCSTYIKVVRRYSRVIDVEEGYSSLYGKPLGEVKLLSNMRGYTEVSAIHFEGEGFSSATNQELAMIESEFADGVILKSGTVKPFTITSNVTNGVFVGTPQQFVNRGQGFTLTVDANPGYELSASGISVTGATFVRIREDTTQEVPRYDIVFSNAVSNVNVSIALASTSTQYSVTASITNGKIISVPEYVNLNQQFDVVIKLDSGYTMDNISYSNCELISIKPGGNMEYTLTFGQVSGNVSVIITPVGAKYQATISVVNGTLIGPSTMEVQVGTPFVVTVDADTDFELSRSGVNVTGATLDRIQESTTQDKIRYDVFFTNVTGNVSVTIRLSGTQYSLDVTMTNGTIVSKPDRVAFDEEFEIVVSVDDGYELTSSDVSVTNATLKTIS